jgi:undecaprenyl-diphosphatase
MSWLLELDENLLRLINKVWTNDFFDWFFPALTEFHKTRTFVWIVLPGLITILIWKKRRQGAEMLLLLILALATNDYLCGKVLKQFFQRYRPPEAGIDTIVRAPYFSPLSFPSNHASNAFCAATILAAFFPKQKYSCFFLAFLIAYSRSYVGVHYPLDWIGGGFFGFFVAWIYLKSYFRLKGIKNE